MPIASSDAPLWWPTWLGVSGAPRSWACLALLAAVSRAREQAGLLPTLAKGALPGSADWPSLVLRPSARPLDTLAAALAAQQGADMERIAVLAAALEADDRALLRAADLLLAEHPGARLLLVVDQAEELWTLALAAPRKRFVDLLVRAVESPNSPVRVVWAMRADFLGEASAMPELARLLGDHSRIISAMTPEELREAIEQPATLAGGRFEPGLVDQLVLEVFGQPGALPLLQYTLLELWRQRRPDRTMTWQAFRAMGGVEGALAARANAILEADYADEARRALLREALLRLVQPGEGTADTRRRVSLADLAPTAGGEAEARALIQRFVDARLLVLGADAGAPLVEVAHEALIRAWPTLAGWIEAAREDLRVQRQIEQAVREWAANGESADFLWAGVRLANVTAWQARTHPRLSQSEQRFLAASQAAEAEQLAQEQQSQRDRENLAQEQRRARTLRRFLVTLGALLAVAVNFGRARIPKPPGGPAGQPARPGACPRRPGADRAARHTRARHPARAGRALQPGLGQGAAGRPSRLHPLDTAPLRGVLRGHTAEIMDMCWSPDGRTVATGYDNTRVGFENGEIVNGGAPDPIGVRVWGTSSGTLTRTIPLPNQRSAVHLAWRPDGSQLLIGSDDATTRVVDAVTGALEYELSYTAPFSDAFELGSFEGDPVPVERSAPPFYPPAAWSSDGQRVIVGDADRFVRVWDLSENVIELELPQEQPISQVAWSPDGQHLLTIAGHVQIYSALNRSLERDLPTGAAQVAAWSPDGRQLLTAGQDSLARLWALDDSAQLRMISDLHVVGALAWRPDSRQILVGLPSQVQLLDAQSLALQHTLAIPEGSPNTVRGLAWSPDGTRFAAGGIGNPTLTVWDTASRKVLQSLNNRAAVYDTAWSPDGRLLAVGTKSGARIWDAATGQALHDLRLEGAGVIHSVAWSPDSQKLANGGIFGRAGIWDAASGKLLRELNGHTSTIWALAWSPDGTRIVSASVDKTVRVWDAETGELLYDIVQPYELFSTAWSSDGRWIATGGWGEVVVIEAASGSVVRRLRGHAQPIEAVAWSPDGSVLLSGGDDGTVRFWLSDLSSAAAVLERRACAANDDSAIRQAVPNWDWRGCPR
jgi:WD40 repeat protein